MTFRDYDAQRDLDSVKRIWRECGWIDDDDEAAFLEDFFAAGNTLVATIDGEAECSVHCTPGTIAYQEETLDLGAVTAVTTSHISRKLGFARQLTAQALARQAEAGMAVSALGMFDQGFYDKVGFGTGAYEHMVHFDPANLKVDNGFRPPKRLTTKNFPEIYTAMLGRRKGHGAVCLTEPRLMKAELNWTVKPFGLGYYDGPGGTLSHFIWGEMKGEHGPYSITWRAYQNNEQLFELLALIKSLGDQVNSIHTLEFGELQLQDLLKQPFRHNRATAKGLNEQSIRAVAYWQARILNLESCLASTHLPGPGVSMNLVLEDPVSEHLPDSSNWRGLSGNYIVKLGPESEVKPGEDKSLPTLKASINAFSRLWLGVRPASSLMITDRLAAEPDLIKSLDAVFHLPRPHLGWDF